MKHSWKRKWKRLFSLLLVCVSLFSVSAHAEVTQEDIDNAQSQIEQLEKQQKEKEDEIKKFEEQQGQVGKNLTDLNESLASVQTEINQIEKDIQSKEEEILLTQENQNKAEEQAKRQYESMKIRIQYMYENSTTNMVELLFQSESIADFLNRTEYIKDINAYDRAQLESYRLLVAEIEQQKKQLEQEKEELLALETEIKQKKETVNKLILNAKNNYDAISKELEQAQTNAQELEQKISEMEALEEQLEEQKAREDAKRLAEILEQEKEDTSGVEIVVTESDAYLLGAIIQCEAEGESYEGKLAVGSVILNRVKSSYFPNSISGVIYQSGQFSPVASGRLAYRLSTGVNSECLQAAQSVLDGNITLNCLYFRRNNGLISGTVIGNHVFY